MKNRDFLNVWLALHLAVWLIGVVPGTAWAIYFFVLSPWHYLWAVLWLLVILLLRYADRVTRELHDEANDDYGSGYSQRDGRG